MKNDDAIPHIIHLIWVGGNSKPKIIEDCIASWKRYLPDYQIIEWNEDNYDVFKNDYLKQAYLSKKWAFVSDYMRFDILNQYGGIYFDTDVELLKAIPSDVLKHQAFTGVESAGKVAPGLVFGCEKGFWLCKEMIEVYNNGIFDFSKPITVNLIISGILQKKGFIENNEFQIVDGLAIYPNEYFCAFDQDIREVTISDKTISIHHYAGTWNKKIKIKIKIITLFKKILGIKLYRKLLLLKRKALSFRLNK